jgi:FdhE protein
VIDDETRQSLQALEEAGIENPDFSATYAQHARLFRALAEARAHISSVELELGDDAALQARLLQGLPLLSFGQVPLEADRFAELVSNVAGMLVASNPDLEGQTVPTSPPEWLALARQRFEEGQVIDGQASAEEGGGEGEPSLAQMSVDLALRPYLEWAAEQVLPRVEEAHWRRNYFAFLGEESGTRHLLCSRCSSEWTYRRVGCPFCGTADHTKLSYYLSEEEVYRLYVCQACRRYLKVLDLRKVGRQILFPVERITTVGMDVAARQQGYT